MNSLISASLRRKNTLLNTSLFWKNFCQPKKEQQSSRVGSNTLTRAPPGKVRLAFLPEEWFLFMQQKTGVTGLYCLILGVGNYCISKEVYVMEHEYYSGLSVLLIVMLVYNKLGDSIASGLDKEVEAYEKECYKTREDEITHYETLKKTCETNIWMAEGQKLLIDAKKENVKMQLEAAYRERMMHVYRMVTGRLDYHSKYKQSMNRIHQKWMVQWILKKVQEAITPDFKKSALQGAISDLEALAARTR